jgi:pilus assembly protein CpaE
MLRAVIISPDAELESRLTELTQRVGRVAIVKSSDRYLVSYELERFLRANAPQIVFLNIAQLNRALEVLHGMETVMPGLQVIAVDRGCDPAVLLDLMHIGVREFLAFPFDGTSFLSTVSRLEEVLEKKPAQIDVCDNVFAFLPSKAGAGTSTLCLNAAVALSRMDNNHTLLMDLDLNSGLIGFMLKLDNVYTIYEAAENAPKLDEHLWPQLVASIGGLDILPAGRLDPQTRIDPLQVRQLVSFARRFYRAICIDLSGNMEKFSLEVMQEAKRIFLVCTPEIPALHLARQKYQLLHTLDLGDRVCVLLNRAQRKPLISTPQIEQLLGVPVYQEFPNDYRGVHEAVTSGREINPNSELGRNFSQLSYSMMEKAPPARSAKKRKKFLEYFAVNPSRAQPAG